MKGNMDEADGYYIQEGQGLTDEELAASLTLLERGAAVNIGSAAEHLPNSHFQVLATRDDEIVGVGAIKRARPHYAAKTSCSSGYQIDPAMPELGYVTVDQEHRGHHLSSRIVAALMTRAKGPLFATTDKVEMKTVLAKNGFVRCGGEWDGETGCLSLWIRPPH
jgi:predicted GNAT family N-acyltransferase